MRGRVDDLESAAPLVLQLPGVYQEDEFTCRFLGAFDDALAPVLATLDDLAAYIDPRLAPDDFVGWLAGWVGVELDAAADLAGRRALVTQAVSLHRRRGTVDGLREAVALMTSGAVTVVESGAAAWSRAAGSPLPGDAEPRLHVRVVVPDPAAVDLRRLTALVADVKPAHIPHTVEVVAG